jgi:hypothetical protein
VADIKEHPSSFRDPSGSLFLKDGLLYRQINRNFKENYDHLINSGLYSNLVTAGLLIPHQEVNINFKKARHVYKVIKPQLVPFISYPYEWCFSQLKNSALTTLKIQKIALEFGMSLKDCCAWNIQFYKGEPILIDTLSFERYKKGRPWVAYRQFCQHFFAPLVLMSYKDIRLNQLLRIYIDGVPLDLASSLLPFGTYFKFSILSHIHLHAKSQRFFANKTLSIKRRKVGSFNLFALVDNLEIGVKNLNWKPHGTEWINYYEVSNYSPKAMKHKKEITGRFLDSIKPRNVWDLGANTGVFSRLASNRGIMTISFDSDPAAVEKNYLECIKKSETNLLPLLLDLTNPSPSVGWENRERMSIFERGPVDTVFALALIHHLAISNNLPLNRIASFFSKICNSLIIEFVPKSDSQVQRLLLTREDIFLNYTQKVFEEEFRKFFSIKESVKIKTSERFLYLMQNKIRV